MLMVGFVVHTQIEVSSLPADEQGNTELQCGPASTIQAVMDNVCTKCYAAITHLVCAFSVLCSWALPSGLLNPGVLWRQVFQVAVKWRAI